MLKALCVAVCAAISVGAAAQARDTANLQDWTLGEKPNIRLSDTSGAPVDLQDLRGRAVVVHFWATYCEPCIPELSALNALAAQYRDLPLAILSVDVGEVDARVRRFLEKLPVRFPVALDRDRAVAKAWDVYALPTSFVLDRSLTPKLYAIGAVDWAAPETVRALDALVSPE